MKIPVARPQLDGNELKYVMDCIKSGWISWRGKYADRFEEEHAKRHGYKYGVATTSGTTALTLAIAALNIGEGDEVIVPEFTMVASAWAVTYNNAKPVFVDCDDNLLIDIDKIEEKITKRTKAIMPVSIFGRYVDTDRIKKLALKYNLKVVEDLALAHGLDAHGDIACYALFANKILTSGEGGICLTNDKDLAERLKYLKNMAFDPKHTFLHQELGFNFRLTNIQAAIACAQLERLDEFLIKRRQIEEWYNEGLESIPEITIMPERRMLWMYDVLAENKDELMEYLEENGIETRHFFKPMSQQPMYYDKVYKNLKATKFSERGFYLPTFTSLKKEEVEYICNKIEIFYNKKK